jgi:hypothetical protein
MKRRTFVEQVAIGGLVGAGASTAAASQDSRSSGAAAGTDRADRLMTTPLALMAPREDGACAVWGVSELCKGRIEWEGPDGSRGTAASNEIGMVPQGTSVIRVPVGGLRPGCEYRVRCVTTSASQARTEAGPWHVFRTLNSSAPETRFVVWNDTHVHDETIQRLDDATPAADFLVWNGDTCNDWRKHELLVPTILNPANRAITDARPLFLVWGNHDVRGEWAFGLPQVVATPSGRPFYAFRSGPVAGLCLHTGEDKPDDHPSFAGRVAFDALRAEQTAWLRETIALPMFRDAPYRVVFCHIPLRWTTENIPDYAQGGFDLFSHRSREAWHEPLVQWKTQLVISGHTHQHAWIPPSGRFPYGQLTGGGPKLSQATWIEAVANERSLTIHTHALDGGQPHTLRFDPVA